MKNVQSRGSKLVHELKDLNYKQRRALAFYKFGLQMWLIVGFGVTYKFISGYYDMKLVLKMDTYGKIMGYTAMIFTERSLLVSQLHKDGIYFKKMWLRPCK